MADLSFDGLAQRYASRRARVLDAVDAVLMSGTRLRGEPVGRLEAALSALSGATAIAVSSGTVGMELALKSMGVQAGDHVIVPAFSFAATAGAVLAVGASPVFVDVAKADPFIDLEALGSLDLRGVKAVIGVHLFGTVRPQQALLDFCTGAGLALLEDAAQSLGAYVLPDFIGPEVQHAAVLSFDPYKVLPGIAGGGAVLTRNPSLLERLKLARCHGYSSPTQDFVTAGTNAEMSAINAGALMVELDHLEEDARRRREVALAYASALEGVAGVRVVTDPKQVPNNHHKFVLASEKRDDLGRRLAARSIPYKIHYNRALPDYTVFRPYAASSFDNARRYAATVLSLPIHPHLSPEQSAYICRALGENG